SLLPRLILVVTGGLAGRSLRAQLPGEILSALPQLGLLSRQRFELTLQLLFAHRVALACKLLLTLHQFVLTLREGLDLAERALARVLTLLGSRSRLVVRLLGFLKLLIEQRGDVEVSVATVAETGLLPRHLSTLHVGLSLEEVIQRLHLGLQSAARIQRI